jgi:copper(I)-binding protein
VVGLAAALPLAAVTGCGAGRNTTTDKERQTPYVATAHASTIAIRGARLLVTSTGASASPTASPDSEAQGYLTLAVVNKGPKPDTLTNATVDGGAVTTSSDASGLSVDPEESLVFGVPGTETSVPTLEVVGFTSPLRTGTFADVSLTFQTAGTVSLQVPVESMDLGYSTDPTREVPLTGSYPSPSTTVEP